MPDTIDLLRDVYGLHVDTLEPIDKGHMTDNYKVITQQGDYFLKQNRVENAPLIDYITSTERYFFERGCPVVMPVTHGDGQSYFWHDGKPCVLYPFVAAEQKSIKTLDEDGVARVATFLAHLHMLGTDAGPAFRQVTHYDGWDRDKALNAFAAMLDHIAQKDEQDAFDATALIVIPQKIAFIERHTRRSADFAFANDTLIHGDYHCGNMFFDEQDEICGLFDFEKCCYAPRERDLMRSLFFICLSGSFEPERIAAAKVFLAAYHARYPLRPDNAGRALDAYAMRYMHSTWIEGEHYHRHNTRLDELYQKTVANSDLFANHYEAVKDELLSVLA